MWTSHESILNSWGNPMPMSIRFQWMEVCTNIWLTCLTATYPHTFLFPSLFGKYFIYSTMQNNMYSGAQMKVDPLRICLRFMNCEAEIILSALTGWLIMLTSLFLELQILLHLLWTNIKPLACSNFILLGERMTTSYQLVLAYYPEQEQWNSLVFNVKVLGKS